MVGVKLHNMVGVKAFQWGGGGGGGGDIQTTITFGRGVKVFKQSGLVGGGQSI